MDKILNDNNFGKLVKNSRIQKKLSLCMYTKEFVVRVYTQELKVEILMLIFISKELYYNDWE